ncbi:MAG: MMPL family transporter [Dehalogenimonas sp.]
MNINKGIAALARNSARRPWLTIGAWITALAVSGVLIVTLLGGALVTDIEITDNPESLQASNLIDERLSEPSTGPTEEPTDDEMVIVRSAVFTVDDPEFRAAVEALYSDLLALGDGVVKGGVTYYMTGDESMVSTNRHATLIPLVLPGDGHEVVDQIYAVGNDFAAAAGFEVFYTGNASFNADTMKLAEDTMTKGETIGILVAMVVLAAVFGAVVAALLPIALGVVAIVAALGLAALVGQAMDLTFFITNMVTMMGLAVGIDYSLFVVSRYREEREKGLDKIEAISMTGATANRAIFFSGMTVILALVGLLFFPLSIFKSMGLGSILVVFTAIIASMTLLPAVISLLGDRLNRLRMPWARKHQIKTADTRVTGFWASIVRVVTHKPLISVVLTAGVLLLALVPFFDKNTGMSGISGLPDDLPAKAGFMVLQSHFHMGMDDPAIIVIDGDIENAATQSGIAKLTTALGADATYSGTAVQSYPEKNLAVIYAVMAGDPQSKASMDSVATLRSELIPQAFGDSPARALVTGNTASILDFNQTTADYTPFIFAFVLSLSFIILMVAFRSIVIPATAIIMNLLSVGAAYGLLVLVFQQGVGADLFGFIQVDVIESWLPLMLFALLFGLSMDYQVFLLSRIRERYLQTGNTADAIAFGLSSTGKLITGAALIMVAVFGGFALGDMAMFQQMGFGLAVAVLIDATLVRSVLVPAAMTLLGDRNWYLPKWLNWLPNLSIGEETTEASHPIRPSGHGPLRLPNMGNGMVPVPVGITEEDREY